MSNYGGVAPRSLILAILLLPLLLAGCGGGGGGGSGGDTGAAQGFRIVGIDPVDGAFFVSLDSEIRATFSEPIYVGKIHEQNFLVSRRTTGLRLSGTVRLENGNFTAVFTPEEDFLLNTGYEVRVYSDVSSIGGEVMAKDFVSRFTSAATNNPPAPPPLPTPRQGAFRPVGDMTTGRSSHTATLLTNRTVLLTGGFSTSSTVTDTAEAFDPSTDEFSPTTGKLGVGRAFHAAVRLTSGKVLLLGGVAGSSLIETNSAEIYDPTTRRFSSAGTMVKARAFHTATVLGDNRVLILGGTVPGPSGTFSSRAAEAYNPSTGTFTALPDMAVFRATHTATLLSDGKVLIVGGNGSDTRGEIFDPSANTFTTLVDQIDNPRRGHTANLLSDGSVLLMGGEGSAARSAEIYDARQKLFRPTLGNPLKERKDHSGTMTVDGFVLVGGGSRLDGLTTFFNRSTELFRVQDERFLTTSPPFSVVRTRHRATKLSDGRILVTGGSNLDFRLPELATAEIYETE